MFLVDIIFGLTLLFGWHYFLVDIRFWLTLVFGWHYYLGSVMSMHFWRFFHFFEFIWFFWVNWTIEKSPVLKKKFKKISGASCSRTLHSWNATTPYHIFNSFLSPSSGLLRRAYQPYFTEYAVIELQQKVTKILLFLYSPGPLSWSISSNHC